MSASPVCVYGSGGELEVAAVFVALVEEELVLYVLLCGDESRLRQAFVVARDFNLLAVFADFLEVVVVGCEFLEFLFKV